jgi:hypothetical protein
MSQLVERARPETDDRFVERFAAAWHSHDREQIRALLHPDVVLIQPVMRPLHGRDAATQGMLQFLELMPDLEITIDRALREADRVFIAFRFVGTLGRRRVTLAIVDQLDLVDGLVHARTAFFDPTPLLRAALSQPRLWPRLVREFRRMLHQRV